MKLRSEFLSNLVGHNLRRGYFVATQIFTKAFADHQISPVQFAILEAIALNVDITQKEIAEIADSSPQAIVPLIKKMEQSGLIERVRSENDRRFHHLSLTAEGEKKHRLIKEKLPELDHQLVGPLSAAERETLLKLLLKIVDG